MLREGCNLEMILELYEQKFADFEMFMEEVHTRTTKDGKIAKANPGIIYTSKKRIKSEKSLSNKVIDSKREIDQTNVFQQISDIAGIRLIVLHYDQMKVIDNVIRKNVTLSKWAFREKPKAYESDIRVEEDLKSMGFDVERKDSYYTSIHYLVQPLFDEDICCEIQIRTILEEIWSEIDHRLRYKSSGQSHQDAIDVEMKLRVFSNLVQTGRSFLDLVFDESVDRRKEGRVK